MATAPTPGASGGSGVRASSRGTRRTGAEMADPIDSQEAFDVDVDAAIVRDEKDKLEDDVDSRLAGAVLVETVVTANRVMHVAAEKERAVYHWGRVIFVTFLSCLVAWVQLWLMFQVTVHVTSFKRLDIRKMLYEMGLHTVWADSKKTEEDTIISLLNLQDDEQLTDTGDWEAEGKVTAHNPLAAKYDFNSDKRFMACSMAAFAFPMFTLCMAVIWFLQCMITAGPIFKALWWSCTVKHLPTTWEGLRRNQSGMLTLTGLSVWNRIWLIFFLFWRLMFQYALFVIGIAFALTSFSLFDILANIFVLSLIDTLEDLVVRVLLPSNTRNLMENVKLGVHETHILKELDDGTRVGRAFIVG